MILYKLMNIILDFIYPRRCFICDEILSPWEYRAGIHEKCRAELTPVAGRVCMHCGRPITNRNEYCVACVNRRNDTFLQGKALYEYKGTIKETMYRFKYANKREYAIAFARDAVERYGDWMRQNKIDMIVPVPMHQKKQKKRGYNQAQVFGRELARAYELRFGERLYVAQKEVSRVKETAPLKNLGKQERASNLKNAFQISPNVIECGKIALVVDDIYTTGATADALTRALLQAGIQKVFFLSICIGKKI